MIMVARINFNCDDELNNRITAQAKYEDRTKTSVIKRAIKEYLEKYEKE